MKLLENYIISKRDGNNAHKNVLYKVVREHRTIDNPALLYAQKCAEEKGGELFVVFTHYTKPWDCASRTLTFMWEGLENLQKNLAEKNIPLVVLYGKKTTQKLIDFAEKNEVGTIVYDYSPLREHTSFLPLLLEKEYTLVGLDARNLIPVHHASPKQEYGAYTLRPKIYKALETFPLEISEIQKHKNNNSEKVKKYLTETPWETFKKESEESHAKVSDGNLWIGGEDAAQKLFAEFSKNGIKNYGEARNNPGEEGQSNLSPYLTFGHISSRYCVWSLLEKYNLSRESIFSKNKNNAGNESSPTLEGSVAAFVEELIIRRELAENFCYYNKNYDNLESISSWALESLAKARTDTREYLYTYEQFEKAKTHDEIWNAAQRQLVQTGKMHGYMRMYWAKKILEWTKSPEEAFAIALRLNDFYELDGFSPNGYAGILWSIGGLHDRAWFPRPIFGLIRYMAASGVLKRGGVKDYLEKYKEKENTLF